MRSTEDHPWGLRLRLPISFSVFGLSVGDFLGDLDPERVKTLTFVPAAEFLIPLSDRRLLKPRQDFGIGKRRVDFSLYTLVRHYFRELVFDQALSEPLVIEREYEIGITLGSTPLHRIWKINDPRFLIGYRFGENLRAVRLKFGLPF